MTHMFALLENYADIEHLADYESHRKEHGR